MSECLFRCLDVFLLTIIVIFVFLLAEKNSCQCRLSRRFWPNVSAATVAAASIRMWLCSPDKFKHEDKGGWNAIQLIKHFPRVHRCAQTSSFRSHPKSQTSVHNSEQLRNVLNKKKNLGSQFVTCDPTRSLISAHLL